MFRKHKRIIIIVGLITLGVTTLAILGFLVFGMNTCVMPLCNNNARLLGDLCTGCLELADSANSIIDGIRGFIRR